MSGVALTPELLRQQVAELLERKPEATVLGIHSADEWRGQDRLRIGGQTFRVAWCPSTLAVREELVEHEGNGEGLVVVTNQGERELGTDVLGRFPSARLISVDCWSLLRSRFEAQRIDPRLVEENWLAEELLGVAPTEGFRPVPAGFLDAATAWSAYLERRFGLPEGRSDLPALLEWSIAPRAVEDLLAARTEIRDGVLRRFTTTAGTPGEAIGRLIRAERGQDAIPVGLVSRVIFHKGEEGEARRREASIRLEGILDGFVVGPQAGRRWAEGAEELLSTLRARGDDEGVEEILRRGDELLAEVRLEDLAHLSSDLPSGLEQRLERFASTLRDAVESSTFDQTLLALARAVEDHRGSPRKQQKRIDLALKLCRWLTQGGDPGEISSLPEAARRYTDNGAFVDWIRSELWGSEEDAALGSTYQLLLERTEAIRETLNEAFGQRLPDWFSAGDSAPELLPLESILDEVVEEVAGLGSVLLLVIDGLSLPVFHQLQDDLFRRGWVEIGPGPTPERRFGFTLLPSTTRVCRASLLSGKRTQGGQDQEAKGFEGHPALRERSQGGRPPVLFHKADLRSGGSLALHDDVQSAIEDERRRIVGVVINAVDDHLDNSDQLRREWDVESIGPLGPLLEVAAANERLVVLTSDHGHVPEWGLEYRKFEECGQRSRPPGEPIGDGEVLVEGPRVLTSEHRIVVPWSERIRYGRRRSGYHGGGSPAEMLVPISILSSGDEPPEGWREVPVFRPGWWLEPVEEEVAPIPTGEPPKRAIEPRRKKDEAQGRLFPTPEEEEAPPAKNWVDRLFASETFEQQVEQAGRTTPSEPDLRRLLQTLTERGDVATRQALGQGLGLAPHRVSSFVAAVQRVLNVEGFPVIDVDHSSGEVRLNRELLFEQFELR